MEFRKWKRTAEILPMRMWRLASVDEVRNNMETIKNDKILDSWDNARLLDGWMAGPGHRYPIKNKYRSNLENMLLVKTPISRRSDGSFSEEMYAGVELNSEGREAALLLSCDDKITEVMCFVLKNIVDRFEEHGGRQVELDRLMESMMKNFSHGRTVFHYAADQPNNEKHAEYLAELIPRNFEYGKEIIKAADKYGRTALHYAALHGHINLCTFLMNNCELKAKEKDRNGENLLHFVVNRGKAHIVYTLLESPAVRNLFYLEDANGKTPLHKAAAIGDVDTMWTLLETVSLLDQRDTLLEEKNTLLDERVYVLVALLDTLVDKRVSLVDSLVDTLLDTLKKKRESSLDESEKEIVEKLLMDKEIVKQIVKEIVKEHEERTRKTIRQPDFFGQTALLEAVRRGHCEAVRYLLDKGSRPLFERNSEGKTALHYSVQIADKQAAIQMAEILLNHYTSREERLLLLWASAIGMGTAEQSAESSPELHSFLMQQRELAAGSSSDLLFSAIKLGYEALAWEFIDRGANTSQIDNLADRDLSDVERERFNKFLTALKLGGVHVKNVIEGDPDQPTIHDSVGRRVFAEGLAALFLNPYVKSPVTVGISGEWGIGKSSLMLQTEMILIQAAAQQAFPNILPIEDFPQQFKLTRKDRKKYNKVRDGVKALLAATRTDNIVGDPLVYFLDNYQDKYHQVYKSLALMERGEMDKTLDSSANLHKIPNVLTVRYNAWHYRNELEAWAGLAVTITKAMKESMTESQRIRSRWRYTKNERGGEILLQFLLPCILALFLSGLATWTVWMLLRRSKHSDLEGLKKGSIAITLVVIFWTVMRQLLSVFKPVTVQVMKYIHLPDHSTNLGYQHQVISDIKFLKEQICEKPSLLWKFLAGNWLWGDTVKRTSIPKSHPPSKNDLRMIVFVDDLDRCEDTVILKVLSAVNLVLAVCDINVILGMDKKMISRAIANNYQNQYQDNNNSNEVDADNLAEKYLRKIIQLTLALPDLGNDERKEFLNQQLGEEIKEIGNDVTEGSSRPSPGAQLNDPENLHFLVDADGQFSDQENLPQNYPQTGPDSLLDAQPSDVENPHENLLQNHPQSVPGSLSDAQPSDVKYPLQNRPQSGLEKRTVIFKLLNCFRALRSRLYGWNKSDRDMRRSKLKSTIVNSRQLVMRRYSHEERRAIAFLSTQTTDDPQLPREWKRFLLYHRLAWNIFLISKQGKNLSGWQVQLLVWTFCCWQWKDNVNCITKDWKKLVSIKDDTVNDENPSFKTIVEHYVDRNVEPEERHKWQFLIQILFKYDVTMESIQSFEKFRLNCDIGYPLRLPPNAIESISGISNLESL